MARKLNKGNQNLETLIRKAVLEAIDERLGDRFAPADVPPAANNQELMNKLVAAGKDDEEILNVFTARYASEGKTDAEWIRNRVSIYRRITDRLIAEQKGGRRRPSRRARRAA
jgi:phage terminase large subunit-like protein